MGTYDFGDGPVPATRHINPDGSVGGWVATTAQVGPGVYVGAKALVFDEAILTGNTRVLDTARLFGRAYTLYDPTICDNARVSGDVSVVGTCHIGGNACVSGDVKISGRTRITGAVSLSGEITLDNASVFGPMSPRRSA